MSKTCRSCQTRTVGTGNPGNGPFAEDATYARTVDLCRPCATQAGWENMHSDGDHDEDACWVCHPELDRAANPTARQATGTSRVGMVITVPLRASGAEKAAAAKAQINGHKVTVRTVKGITTLKAGTVKLAWDAQGRFDYDASTAGDKKVRNVAAALRILAGE